LKIKNKSDFGWFGFTVQRQAALGLVILSALRNAAKNAAFVLAAVAAKNAALEYRNDASWNTKPEA
jgi:hypothetical protein